MNEDTPSNAAASAVASPTKPLGDVIAGSNLAKILSTIFRR